MIKKASLLIALATAGVVGAAALAQTSSQLSEKQQQGKRVYDRWCVTCHGSGPGLPGFGELPGTHQLRIKYRGTNIPAVLDERTDLPAEYVKVIVRQGVSFMPQFRKLEINDEELDALAAYLTRNNPS